MITTDAWVLHRGPVTTDPTPGELVLDRVRIPEPTDDEVLIEPLYGSWEGNMTHALQRDPVDVCRQRGEKYIVLGNSGVARVLRPATNDQRRKEGDICMVMAIGTTDAYGYAKRIYAYDQPHSFGLLARRTKVNAAQLVPIPVDAARPLQRWAPCLRYFTAWDNWQVAHGSWTTQMRQQDPADHLVFGWGGGVVVAELELARRAGFRVAMTVGSTRRAQHIARLGIRPVLRVTTEPGDRAGLERHFLQAIDDLSDKHGVAIFLDNLGGDLYPIVLRALARQAVISTVGWKTGMNLTTARASECIARHLHIHTHCWRQSDCETIRDYQHETSWLADLTDHYTYTYDEIPTLANKYMIGEEQAYFPTYQVNSP